ncbi:hypothetical protein DFH06DRAFT_1292792 [Mycena polygramma]|nr:hypothetical protein DFH06DRAFT_1292792 [Mycena polygramma]
MTVNIGNAYVLAASWLNCLLFMIEISLMFQYFHLPSKPLLHRIGVGTMFVCDIACTIAVCHTVYLVALVFPCDSDHIFDRTQLTLLAVILVTTYGTASIEQLFLCYLYFSLTKQKLVTAFLVFSVAVHLAFSYASAMLVLVRDTPFGSSILTSKIGAIACAATDIMIASALMFTFVRFERTIVVRVSTQSLLRRLTVLIFASGVLVASTTFFVMLFLLKGIPAYSLFFYCQGRVYSLTILYNFLVGLPGQDSQMGTNPPGSIVTTVAFHTDDYDEQASQRRRSEPPMEMDLTFPSPGRRSLARKSNSSIVKASVNNN